MKNFMKKFMVGFFALAMVLSASSALASGPFNGQSGDCPNMGIGNVNTGVGVGDGQWHCWTTSTVNASAGQFVNVVLFYHNNTNSTLTNVQASLSQSPSSGASTGYTFTGTMSSNQGTTSLGSVYLNLTNAQNLTYVNSHWFANKNAINSNNPTQDGTFNGGSAYIGSVPPGWDDYGELLLVYKVEGTTTPYYNNCTISNFSASPSSISYGGSTNLSWNTSNCSNVTVTGPNFSSNALSSYGQTVYPTSSGTYVITAYGTNGSVTQSTYVSVGQPYIYTNPTPVYYPQQPVVVNACAVTSLATNVTQTSATLNGIVSSGSGNAYFEYGTSATNLNTRTETRSVSGSYNSALSGLAPDTIYYYRAVADCNGVTSRGTVEFLSTAGNTVVRPIIVQGTTVVGTASPIMLKIEDKYETIGVGDVIDYTVTYKNIGRSLLTHPMVQVIVPKGIVITNASSGTYNNDSHTLSVPLQDLKAGDSGVVYLQARVDSLVIGAAQVVTNALLVYTAPNNSQENAMAYVLNTPKSVVTTETATTNNLGAAAFLAGILPGTLIGWLLLIILILLIILLTRRYTHTSVVTHSVPQPPYSNHH